MGVLRRDVRVIPQIKNRNNFFLLLSVYYKGTGTANGRGVSKGVGTDGVLGASCPLWTHRPPAPGEIEVLEVSLQK